MGTSPILSHLTDGTAVVMLINTAYILGEFVICIDFSHFRNAAQVLRCNIQADKDNGGRRDKKRKL
jgi:hypothetical protein